MSYNDPLVPSLRLGPATLKSIASTPDIIGEHDCVVILTDHSAYDIREIVDAAKLVIDTRNVTKDLHAFKDKIIKLGAGNNPRPTTYHDDGHESTLEMSAH